MSVKGLINFSLYRPLKEGTKYNSYFPSVTCASTYLGEGNTYYGVDEMKSTILKYATQTKKIATILQQNTLSKTVDSIYSFLYHHIQYKSDAATQQLRSPACSWHDRKKGIDCKSYSIFAGSILSMLGIKYYIRQVRQPGMLPEQFTHVYIVVPKNQNNANLKSGYFVIDATKHSNTEGSYVEAKDIFMSGNLKYVGLNAPTLPISGSGDFEGRLQPISDKAVQAFYDFLSYLAKIGIDADIISAAKKHFLAYLEKGIDPQFAITKRGFVIGQKLFPYTTPKTTRTRFISPISIASQMSDAIPNSGLNGEGDDTVSDEELGDEIATIAGDIILDSSWWNNTIGAVMGNGWDFTCLGASNNPKKSHEEVMIDSVAYFKASGVGDSLNTENLAKFIKPVYIYMKHREWGQTNDKVVKCTRRGDEAGFIAMKAYYDKMMASMKTILEENNGQLVPDGIYSVSQYNIPAPSGFHDGNIHPHETITTIFIPKYKVIAPQPVNVPVVVGNDPNGDGTTGPPIVTGDETTPTGGGTTVPTPTNFNNITPTSGATLINQYINHLIANEGLRNTFNTKAGRMDYYNLNRHVMTLSKPVVLKALYITSVIDGRDPNEVFTAPVQNVPVTTTVTTTPQKASINPLVLLLAGGAVYAAYKKNKSKSKK